MTKKFSWSAPSLAPDDERLVDAYNRIARPLDYLPYTDDFEALIRQLDYEKATDEDRAQVFRRLLNLRKMARLPPADALIDVAPEEFPLSAEDQELLSAYQRVGRPLDALPYTPDFEKLIEELGRSKTQALRHAVFQRLLRLRKRGRLPSLPRKLASATINLGSGTLTSGYNIISTSDCGSGLLTITFAEPFSNGDYDCILTFSKNIHYEVIDKTENGFTISFDAESGSPGWLYVRCEE